MAAFAIFFIGIGIRMFLVKDGEFRGSCSSQNVTGDEECQICGRKTDEGCGNEDDELMKAAIEAEKTSK